MKVFKVELTNVKREYASVEIEADSRTAAIEIARKMTIKDFDLHEETKAHEITAKKRWSFFDLF